MSAALTKHSSSHSIHSPMWTIASSKSPVLSDTNAISDSMELETTRGSNLDISPTDTMMHSKIMAVKSCARQPSREHLPSISIPDLAKLGPFDTIRKAPSVLATPSSEVPAIFPSDSPNRTPSAVVLTASPTLDEEDASVIGYPDVGIIASWRGMLILLVTCGAQLLDNIFMTGVNISLPAIQKEFQINDSDLQWLISAYTLTFGGFLLVAGVLSDRHGRKNIFCVGMAWLSIWTIANSVATSFIQLTVFRALQGIGAAMTVPSSVGIISAFFTGKDRTKALAYFGASGAVGFCVGLLAGGFLTSSLGWRYLFYLTVIVAAILGLVGWFVLPKDRRVGRIRPRLDFLGAALSTSGLILLSFVLSSGGEYGWSKAFIIVLLIASVLLLILFTYVEKKISDPIMPLSLWKVNNFAAIWITGFVMYGAYQVELYYLTLISQESIHLTAGSTALRLLPMGCIGAFFAISMGTLLDRFDTKLLLRIGLACCAVAPIPTAMISPKDLNFWTHVFPTSVIGIIGIAMGYCTITVVLLASVPVSAKSLCGGMINTAFQLGSGVALALATAVVQGTANGGEAEGLKGYKVGMWCSVGLSSVGLAASLFGVRNIKV